jgi:hypothetical protein
MWSKTLGGYAARVEFRLRTMALQARGIRTATDLLRLDLKNVIKRELRLVRLRHEIVEKRHAENVRRSPASRRRFTLEEFVDGDIRRMPVQDAIDAIKNCTWYRRDRCVEPIETRWLIDRLIVMVHGYPPESSPPSIHHKQRKHF